MIKFLTRHPEKIYIPLLEHIQLVFLTLVISVAIASILTLLCMRSERLSIAAAASGRRLFHPLAGPFCHPDPCDGIGQDDGSDRADRL